MLNNMYLQYTPTTWDSQGTWKISISQCHCEAFLLGSGKCVPIYLRFRYREYTVLLFFIILNILA